MPLACAIALCQSSAVQTATAGPNSSSWLNGDAGSTSATTAGDDHRAVALAAGQQPGAGLDRGLRWTARPARPRRR